MQLSMFADYGTAMQISITLSIVWKLDCIYASTNRQTRPNHKRNVESVEIELFKRNEEFFFFNSIKLKGYFVIERERDAVHAHVIAFF